MDKIKRITKEELLEIASDKGFEKSLLEKDYLLTELLYLIRDIEGLYFKGGTALNKIFLNHKRLSEDLDFTLTRNVGEVERGIRAKLKGTLFENVTDDKRVEKFTRLVVHYKLFHEDGTIFIDLNERGKLLLKPEKHNLPHFYAGFIPEYEVITLAKKEMLAEKMAAAIGRNRPRDHYDLYNIIEQKLPLDLNLVRKKCEQSGYEFDITKMFNKAKKLHKKWDEDMIPLLSEEISFTKVMIILSKHFNLKGEKEKLRSKNK